MRFPARAILLTLMKVFVDCTYLRGHAPSNPILRNPNELPLAEVRDLHAVGYLIFHTSLAGWAFRDVYHPGKRFLPITVSVAPLSTATSISTHSS